MLLSQKINVNGLKMRNSFLYLLVIDLVHLGMPLSGEDTIVDIYNRREPNI